MMTNRSVVAVWALVAAGLITWAHFHFEPHRTKASVVEPYLGETYTPDNPKIEAFLYENCNDERRHLYEEACEAFESLRGN